MSEKREETKCQKCVTNKVELEKIERMLFHLIDRLKQLKS